MSDLASFESNRRHLGRVLCLVAVTIVSSGTAAESAGVPPAFRAPRIVRVFAPPPAPPALPELAEEDPEEVYSDSIAYL